MFLNELGSYSVVSGWLTVSCLLELIVLRPVLLSNKRTLFSKKKIIFERRRPPKCRGARGNFPLPSHLDGPELLRGPDPCGVDAYDR